MSSDQSFGRAQHTTLSRILLIIYREHVAGFWPVQDPRPPGDQLSKMYNKILDSQNATTSATGATLANGRSAPSSATAV